jgi:tetratricopeptide (TPR) repeat protein
MDTRSNDSYSFIFYFVFIVAIVTSACGNSFADSETAAEVLIATYELPPAITPERAELVIAALKKAQADCKDNYLSFRIKYRIGVIYFKAGMSEAAKARFEQIVNVPDCPELIRACSLNMTGQISRLRGENKIAPDAFEKAAVLFEQNTKNNRELATSSVYTKLLYSALFSRAEIFELERDFKASITEYNRLLNVLGQDDNGKVYMPFIIDKISGLYLRLGEIDDYIKFAEGLIRNYPQYYRVPVIELEIECVKFLRNVSENPEFNDGSFTAPAQTITYLKESKSKNSAQHIFQKLDELCKKHRNSYAGILLRYNYACFLDAVSDKEKAAEELARVFSDNVIDTDGKSLQKAIENIREYAKIQYAIISSERSDYKQALRVLSSLTDHPSNSDISELAKSVTESIQILRREVLTNENEER